MCEVGWIPSSGEIRSLLQLYLIKLTGKTHSINVKSFPCQGPISIVLGVFVYE